MLQPDGTSGVADLNGCGRHVHPPADFAALCWPAPR